LTLLTLLPLKLIAQQTNLNISFAEKIYLQLDNNIYTPGNTIWFKCIVAKATNHTPSTLSGVLYVELITPQEKIYQKRIIKIKNGIGQGSFNLDKNLPNGRYLIRAYTQWNKNFGESFYYENYIELITPENEENPISNVTLIKNSDAKNSIKATFNPNVIDSLQKRKLKVIVVLDGKKDTLLIKKDRDDAYRIDYPIQDKSPFVTLQMLTEHQKSYTKTILLNKDYIDFQFFPESGELVHGLPSKVGFKILDVYGKGKQIQGNIVDEKDSIITSFKSNFLGMGSFVLNNIDSTKNYYASLKYSKNQSLQYPLPSVSPKGNVLFVTKQKKRILVSAASNYLKNDSVFVDISCRGIYLYNIKTILNNGGFHVLIPNHKLPEGIISFTMLDNQKQPIAERLFFNTRDKSKLNIHISTDKNKYAKRALTNLKIATTNAKGKPVNANLSLLVINKKQMGDIQRKSQNILSYFLMESDLKGEIENPGYYFNGDSIKQKELDALMLTQGWRKYNYNKPTQEITFSPEQQLSISGQVSSPFFKKKPKEAELDMITFGKKESFYNQKTDSLGKFKFYLDEEYGKDLKVLIQTAKKSGKKVIYDILFDKKGIPPIKFHHKITITESDSIVQLFVKKNKEREKIEDDFLLQSGNVLLEEVELTLYKMTPNRKKVMEKYGKPDVVINGDKIREKEKKWSFGLYSILSFNDFGKIEIYTGDDQVLKVKIDNTSTLVIVDGIPVKSYDFSLIPYIPASEVSSLEIIESAQGFLSLYCSVHPEIELCELTAPASGNILSIYTYGQKGIYGVQPAVGITHTSIPVFSPSMEFYAPKYKNIQDNNWNQPDLRALIHWNPIIKTDSIGKASASFYNADNTGKMTIVVEAISKNGEIGYKEVDFLVD
jgi:hypothetical protein